MADIYIPTKPGVYSLCRLVRYTGKNGTFGDRQEIEKHLKVGDIRWAESIAVGSWRSTVNVEGCGNFNTCCFEVV